MKPIISSTILIGVLIAVVVAGVEDRKKMFNECKDQEKASDEDVQNMINHKMPQGLNAKCFLACVQEKVGMIKDGKVNPDGFKGPQMKDMIPTGALNECFTIANPDRCELSFKLGECIQKAWAANGTDMKKN